MAACTSQTSGEDTGTPAPVSTATSRSSAPSSAYSPQPTDTTQSTGPSPGTPGTLKIVPDSELDSVGAIAQTTAPSNPTNPAGDGSARCTGVAIAAVGSFTGPDGAFAQNVLGGAKVAVNVHNSANKGCQVELKEFDLGAGSADAATVAQQIADDRSIVGVVGPVFTSEMLASGAIFDKAGLATLTPSATATELAKKGWNTFFRGVANDTVQGVALGKYLVTTETYFKVCVLSDDSAYGLGLAKQVTKSLGGSADPPCSATVPAANTDLTAIADKINAESPDAVYYAGFYPQTAPLLTALRKAGVTAAFVSSDGSNAQQFVDMTDTAANGTTISCGCAPAPDAFAKQYAALIKQDPGAYSTESYDLATILLTAVDGGKVDRPAVTKFVRSYQGPGLARTYSWNADGELPTPHIWIYQVQ